MQTQLSRFCKNTAKFLPFPFYKITTKSTHFLPVKKRHQYSGSNFKKKTKKKTKTLEKTQKKKQKKKTKKKQRIQNFTSKHHVVKNLQIAKTFEKCE